MRDGPTFTRSLSALAVLLVLAGCQNLNQFRSSPINQSGSSNISDWESKHVCWRALEQERIAWDYGYPQEVAEAKYRGLSEQQCARLSVRFTEAQIAASQPNKLVHSKSNEEVCSEALMFRRGSPLWTSTPSLQNHVREAKQRDLTEWECANISDKIRTHCKFVITLEKPTWETSSRYAASINEVKLRGLTEQQCVRLSGRFTEAQIASASSAPPRLIKSSLVQEAQRLLISLGHFSDSADGFFGQKTKNAVVQFQRTQNGKADGEINSDLIAALKAADHERIQSVAVQIRSDPNPITLANQANEFICQFAVQGLSPAWSEQEHARNLVKEAMRRGLTELQCARLTGRFSEKQLATASFTSPTSIKSDLVKEAQRLLINLGYLRGRADGIQGNQTLAAVNSFERSQRQTETGAINDELIVALKAADQARIQSAKMNVAKSLVQLREEQRLEQERLRKLREEAAKTRKEIADASKARKPNSTIPTNINFGNYHALVIGINKYRNLPKLRTAVADAEAIGDVLKTKYGFKVTTLIDPTRETILQNLGVLRAKLKFSDNLLIYYAGHGWLDEAADEGYWQPSDAKKNQQWGWVSNASITTSLRAIKAKHVMVMADSCYSGKLTRGANTLSRGIEIATLNDEKSSYLTKMARRKTRVAMTSGNLEPVEDGQGKHSPFARAILNALNENEGVIDGTKLHNAILTPVVANTNQTPQYRPIKNAGHCNGNFLFVRRK